ncbi:MAG: SH3 domain-containing protein, partial [Planctomycetota bacterium]
IASTSVGFAQEAAPSFPYVAEINAENVNIRSGPGTNYYRTGQINKGDTVKVVASKHSWSHIVPPPGSFSWISKQYIHIEDDNPTVGIVTGDAVRVYAGSEWLKPIHSTTVQLKLNRGDRVKLMGEEKDDYYKIVPPTGAYLWVSTQYVEPLGPVGQVAAPPEPQVEVEKVRVVVPTSLPLEAAKLKEYYELQKRMQDEHAKPLEQQNYAQIKEGLAAIAAIKESGKAARYAAFAVKQIERYELAQSVAKEVRLQDAQLQKIQSRIDKTSTMKFEEVPELGRFAVIGWLQTSSVYAPQAAPLHYRVLDDNERTICYAVAAGSALDEDLRSFVGRKVGLVGTIQPHAETKGALVRFIEVVELP